MKSVLSFVAVCALACTLAACKSDSKSTASPGAVGETKSGCCAEKSAAMGAVGEKKEGCASSCGDKAKTDASMGAVSETKAGCSTPCSDKAKTDASLGAVSEKSSCTKVCPASGKTLN